MPHPEQRCEPLLGSDNGKGFRKHFRHVQKQNRRASGNCSMKEKFFAKLES